MEFIREGLADAFQKIEVSLGEFDADDFRIGEEFAELAQAHIDAGQEGDGVNDHAVIDGADDGVVVIFDFVEGKFIVERRDGADGIVA